VFCDSINDCNEDSFCEQNHVGFFLCIFEVCFFSMIVSIGDV